MLFDGMLQHDLRELLPLMQTVGFSDVEIAPAKFRVLGLSILAFVRWQRSEELRRYYSCSRSEVFVFGVWPAWQAS